MQSSMRVITDVECKKGDFILDQEVFCFLQTPKSKQFSLCCMYCARYLGDLDAQLLRAQGFLQKSADFVNNVQQRCSSDSNSRYCSIIMCQRKGCQYGYCSEECRDNDDINNGHWLICAGGRREESNLTKGFLRHASRTNDLFTAGLSVIAKLISTVIANIDSHCDFARAAHMLEHNSSSTNTIENLEVNSDKICALTSSEEIKDTLEIALANFESQYPSTNPFWVPKLSETAKATAAGVNKESLKSHLTMNKHESNRNVESRDGIINDNSDRPRKKQRRQIGVKNDDHGEEGTGEKDENEDEKEEENDTENVSDILEQQAVESWTLLQLLLKYEKNSISQHSKASAYIKDVTYYARTVNVSTEQRTNYTDLPHSNRQDQNQNQNQNKNENQDFDLFSTVVEGMAEIMSFHRWSLLLSSLHSHLVPLQVENPLAAVARSLPNISNIADRIKIYQELKKFLGKSCAISDVSQNQRNGTYKGSAMTSAVRVHGHLPAETCNSSVEIDIDSNNGITFTGFSDGSISSFDLNSESKSKIHELILIDREIVRLAQASSLQSSSSSSSVYVQDSTSIPTENPFNRVGFLAMALVSVIGTNLGPTRDRGLGYQSGNESKSMTDESMKSNLNYCCYEEKKILGSDENVRSPSVDNWSDRRYNCFKLIIRW